MNNLPINFGPVITKIFICLFFLCGCAPTENNDDFATMLERKGTKSLSQEERDIVREIVKRDTSKTQTLTDAIRAKNDAVVDFLLSPEMHPFVELNDYHVCICCSSSIMFKLLSRDSNPNLPYGPLGRQPIHIHAGHFECDSLDALIRFYCDVNAKDRRGFTPLHCAAYSGNINSVKKLLNNYAFVNAQSYSGKTPLHCAAMRKDGDVKIMELLLKRGASINMIDCHGNSALHYAAASKNLEVIKFLLASGCKPEIKNEDGKLYNNAELAYKILTIID